MTHTTSTLHPRLLPVILLPPHPPPPPANRVIFPHTFHYSQNQPGVGTGAFADAVPGVSSRYPAAPAFLASFGGPRFRLDPSAVLLLFYALVPVLTFLASFGGPRFRLDPSAVLRFYFPVSQEDPRGSSVLAGIAVPGAALRLSCYRIRVKHYAASSFIYHSGRF
jgi:hypothetical protein